MADIIKRGLILCMFQIVFSSDLNTTTMPIIPVDTRFEPILGMPFNFPPLLGMAAPEQSNNNPTNVNKKFPGFRTTRALAKYALQQSYPNCSLLGVNDI